MHTVKERAELADICYMTIEREGSKPLEDINTELVNSCIELAGLLLGIQPLSDEELAAAKLKLAASTVRKRKSIKVRMIAAIIAAVLLLGTTAFAFSDWLVSVFGKETIQTIEPGDKVIVENNELESAQEFIEFKSEDELYSYFGDKLLMPSRSIENEFVYAYYGEYSDYDILAVKWIFSNTIIEYTVSINDSTIDIDKFNSSEHEYYSQSGYAYDIYDLENGWQATTVIEQTRYTVFTADKDILITFIEALR